MRFGHTVLSLDEANNILATSHPVDFAETETWVDPNKNVLAERLAAAKTADRNLAKGILLESMRKGETGQQAAGRIEDFLTPLSSRFRGDGRLLPNRHLPTQPPIPLTPRSGVGSSRLRALARTELSRAHGQGTIEAAELNPFVSGVRWNLSGRHPRADACDGNANGSSGGKFPAGVYRPSDVPTYPQHTNCLCFLTQEVFQKISSIVRQLIRRERAPLKDSPFFIADDVQEAEAFAKEVLGVEADYADDLQIGNLTNRAMWDVKNEGGYLPSRTQVRPFTEAAEEEIDGAGTFAQYDPSIDTIEINSLQKKFFANDDLARKEFEDGWFAVGDRIGTLHHELGHVGHYKSNPRGYTTSFYTSSIGDEVLQSITRQVSRYSDSTLEEFYAEVFAGRMAGNRYSEEVDALHDFLRTVKIRETNIDSAVDELINGISDSVMPQFEFREPVAAAAPRPVQLQRTKLPPTRSLVSTVDEDFERELMDAAERRLQALPDSDKIDEALRRYTVGDGEDLNRWLRADRGAKPFGLVTVSSVEDLIEMDRQIGRFLDGASLQEDMLVRRMLTPRSPENPLWDPVLGTEFRSDAYTSTSIWRDWIDGDSVEFSTLDNFWEEADTKVELWLPKGSKGEYIDSWSEFEQGELLLQKEAEFRIVGGAGSTVQLEHVPAGRPFQIPVSRARSDVIAPDAQDLDKFFAEELERLRSDPDFAKVLTEYSEDSEVNNFLRFYPNNTSYKKDIDMDRRLQRIFADSSTREEYIVRRFTEAPDEEHILFNPRIGLEFEDKGYISTSIDPDWFDDPWWSQYDRQLDLYIPPGTKGEYIGPFSISPEQHEFLLDKDQRFIIRDVTGIVDPRTGFEDVRITADLVPKDRPFQIPVVRARAEIDEIVATFPDSRKALDLQFNQEWEDEVVGDRADSILAYLEGEMRSASGGYRMGQGLDLIEDAHFVKIDDDLWDILKDPRSRVPGDTEAYRFIFEELPPSHPLNNLRKGSEFIDEGWVSTSVNPGWLDPDSFEISFMDEPDQFFNRFIVDVPEGSPAIYLDRWGFVEQNELLLPRGGHYKVTDQLLEDLFRLEFDPPTGPVPRGRPFQIPVEVTPSNQPFIIPRARAAGARPYADLSDAEIQDTINRMLKTPFDQRPEAEVSQLAALFREQNVRENQRVIGSLDVAEPSGMRPVTDVEERALFREAETLWNDVQSTDPNLYDVAKDYTAGKYANANKKRRIFGGDLRRDPIPPDPEILAGDQAMDEFFRRVEVDEDIVIFRQMRQPTIGRNTLYENPQVGDEFIDHAFVSTTVDEEALPHIITGYPDRVLEIRVPKGTPGQYFRPVGLGGEKEMILGPGTRFRIVGKGGETPEGLVKAILEVVPEPETVRDARRLSAWPDEINPPDMESALRNAPISKARSFLYDEDVDRFYDKAFRLADTDAQRANIEQARHDAKVAADARRKKAQLVTLGTKEAQDIIDRLPTNPTRYQLRRIPRYDRPEVRRRLQAREQADLLRPDQRNIRLRTIYPDRYTRLLTPKEMEELGAPKMSQTVVDNARRKTIRYVDSQGNEFNRLEPLSEFYMRLARSQKSGHDLARQALRATPDQFAREAQVKTIQDIVDKLWGIKPQEKQGAVVFKRKGFPRGDPVIIQRGNPIIIPRTVNPGTPIIIKRKGSSQVGRVIIPRKEIPLPPPPIASARPQAHVLSDLINEGSAPELNTRLRGIDAAQILRNMDNFGINPHDVIHDFPNFPYGSSFNEAEEIVRDVLDRKLELGIDRTKPNLYGSILNQLGNGLVEQIMRGEPVPDNFWIMGLDEAGMTLGSRPAEESIAGFFAKLNGILFNADQTGFWASDVKKNAYFSSGWSSSPERIGTVAHEFGHWLHYNHSPDIYATLQAAFDPDEWREAVDAFQLLQRVSRYSAKSELEFVAEMYTGIRGGKENLLDEDLMELYEWLGGPSIRGIFDR